MFLPGIELDNKCSFQRISCWRVLHHIHLFKTVFSFLLKWLVSRYTTPSKSTEGLCQRDSLFLQADMECLRKHIRDYRLCFNSQLYVMVCLPIEMGWFKKCIKTNAQEFGIKDKKKKKKPSWIHLPIFPLEGTLQINFFTMPLSYLLFVVEEPFHKSRWLAA